MTIQSLCIYNPQKGVILGDCANCCNDLKDETKGPLLGHTQGGNLHPMHKKCWEEVIKRWKAACPSCRIPLDTRSFELLKKEEVPPVKSIWRGFLRGGALGIGSLASSVVGSFVTTPLNIILGIKTHTQLFATTGIGVVAHNILANIGIGNKENNELILAAVTGATTVITCKTSSNSFFYAGAVGNILGAGISLKKDWKTVVAATLGIASGLFFEKLLENVDPTREFNAIPIVYTGIVAGALVETIDN